MTTEPLPWGRDWTVGLRAWVGRGGQPILGPGRLELLEGIDRWGSISEAARRMGMSYRRAWLLVQRMNEAAGEPLVTAVTGGTQGGGARLTAQGRLAAAAFREPQERLGQTTTASGCST
jgi:molybdate transport system regulatory protein